ncbi:MAG: hypothetical protein U1G07_27800 [Verrucomicrobiota bacterium]
MRLWFGIVREEAELLMAAPIHDLTPVDTMGRTIRDVLRSIADHYVCGDAKWHTG